MRQGIGIYDSGHFPKRFGGKVHPLSRKWDGMFLRCYSEKKQSTHPAYIGCTVAPEFHRYQDFCAWAALQVGGDQSDWELDKDILVRGNKVYSPETCCFVPNEINKLFRVNKSTRGALPIGVHFHTGKYAAIAGVRHGREWIGVFDTPELAFAAYKERKEQIIKEVAAEYRARISGAVYAAMMAYEVKITD